MAIAKASRNAVLRPPRPSRRRRVTVVSPPDRITTGAAKAPVTVWSAADLALRFPDPDAGEAADRLVGAARCAEWGGRIVPNSPPARTALETPER